MAARSVVRRFVRFGGVCAVGVALIAAGGVASATTDPHAAGSAAVQDSASDQAHTFSLSTMPKTASVCAGQRVETMVIAYFHVEVDDPAPVRLSVSGAPEGVSWSFAPAEIFGEPSVLTLVTAARTRPGTYVLTIVGDRAAERQTATFGLTVTS
jgi:hypothetical protein